MKAKHCVAALLSTFFLLLIVACRPNLLRYANIYCSGHYFPIHVEWQLNTHQLIFFEGSYSLKAFVLQIEANNTPQIEATSTYPLYNGWGVDIADNQLLVAAFNGSGQDARIYFYPDTFDPEPTHYAILKNVSGATWHPKEQLLAGIYYPEGGDQHASNSIAIVDATTNSPIISTTYALPPQAINSLTWSGDSKVIAVAQYSPNGLVFSYLFVDDGEIQKSLIGPDEHDNCIANAAWSPQESAIVYSAENETLTKHDIFLENVVHPTVGDNTLTNLTNTPQVDEIEPAWSPNGQQIVYVQGLESEPKT